MNSRYFYIDPAALSYLPELLSDEESVERFLEEFQNMVCVLLRRNDCRFLMDSIMQNNLLNGMYCTDNRVYRMIPLNISRIKNPRLKELANISRDAFISLMNTRVELIEMPLCAGIKGNIYISEPKSALIQEEYYRDYLYFMIGNECTNKGFMCSQEIMTLAEFTLLLADKLSATCSCDENALFNKKWRIFSYHELEDDISHKQKQLRDMLHEYGLFGQRYDVEVVQASHSPIIGHTVIRKYEDIPRRQRKVLDILRYFGLQKIDLRDWGSHSGKDGCVRNCRIGLQGNCIEGWLIIDDISCRILMYFSSPIMSLLLDILGDSFFAKDVQNLQQEIF